MRYMRYINFVSVLQNIEDAAAVDFNYARREVCWIDIYQEEIKCASLASPARARPVSVPRPTPRPPRPPPAAPHRADALTVLARGVILQPLFDTFL